MKKLAILAIAALVAGSAFAQAQWMGSTYINANGTWYQGSGDGTWASGGSFNGADLGTITELTLGGQMQVYAGGDIWTASSYDWLFYKLNDAATYTGINMSSSRQEGNNTLLQTGGVWGDSEAFSTTAIPISNLDAGNYTISVYFGPVDGLYDGDSTANPNPNPSPVVYTANFNIAGQAPSGVPEPATMSLLGLGALALVLRRKLRK